MKHLTIIFILILSCLSAKLFAQHLAEEEAIKKNINNLFTGMRNADSSMVRSAFNQGAILQTIGKTKDGNGVVRSSDLNAFIASIAKPHPEIYDERIVFTKILIDDQLASVWTDYQFYIGDKFSHCGVNSFQLVKVNDSWKIVYLIDTRRKEKCN
ncbi:nuclear transport factor 2 family protein [Nubsella zeaxanthinifaciens]|uniref:nuclear transport factor 2 family protein n=1 Tax=Nubsella zeaxanthinifaciens TaxID=392412 RepID=UPI000DE469D9|nr:nuclear transport factor 2 family protein [Nubsella zeaxanthinifaciens]